MVKVQEKINVHKDGKIIEGAALFDTGSGRSYFSQEFGEKIGYELYPEPKKVLLAIKKKSAELVGRTTVEIEIKGYVLPEEETMGVIKDSRVDAIMGLNIMESYGIFIGDNKITLRLIRPTSLII